MVQARLDTPSSPQTYIILIVVRNKPEQVSTSTASTSRTGWYTSNSFWILQL